MFRQLKSINEILDEHYFPDRKKEIKEILDEFGFEKILQDSYNRLIALKTGDAVESIISPKSATTLALTLEKINQQIIPISDVNKKKKVKQTISEVTIRILLQLLSDLEYELEEIASQFDDIMMTACDLMGYDFIDFKQHFNIEETVSLANNISGTSSAKQIKKTSKNSLAWQLETIALNELISLLNK